MTVDDFRELLRPVTRAIAGKQVDAALADELDRRFPADGDDFAAIERACHDAIAAGWMCREGVEGRRFGRVIESGPETDGFSVDVVDITDFRGPHHRHPTGEVCMVMPVTETSPGAGDHTSSTTIAADRVTLTVTGLSASTSYNWSVDYTERAALVSAGANKVLSRLPLFLVIGLMAVAVAGAIAAWAQFGGGRSRRF